MATYSSILARKLSWTKEPDELQSIWSQGVRHYWVNEYIVLKRCERHHHEIPLHMYWNKFKKVFFFVWKYLILFFNYTILYWFCHISTWIRHRYTRVPHPERSSLLPPRTILLGRPSAPASSIQYHASNLDWRLISYMILYMFQCHSPKPCHPLPLPQSPKDCSIHQCLFCCLVYRVIVTIEKVLKYTVNIKC